MLSAMQCPRVYMLMKHATVGHVPEERAQLLDSSRPDVQARFVGCCPGKLHAV